MQLFEALEEAFAIALGQQCFLLAAKVKIGREQRLDVFRADCLCLYQVR